MFDIFQSYANHIRSYMPNDGLEFFILDGERGGGVMFFFFFDVCVLYVAIC